MLQVLPYDRAAAVAYAHRWALGRNPQFYDYEEIGGDCTNFASQCLYAGTGIMNFTPVYGWYYINANNKAPAWTGVEYFYDFMTRSEETQGPVAEVSSISQLLPGDVVQLSFTGEIWNHSPVVVRLLRQPAMQPADVLIAAHSYDADDRPLNTYDYVGIRFLHFTGVRKELHRQEPAPAVVLMSSIPGFSLEAWKIQAFGFIEKPYTRAHIAGMVEKYIRSL